MASTSSPTDSPMPGPGDPEKSKSRKRPRSRSPTEEPSNSIGDTQTLAGPPSSKRVRVLTPKRPSKRAKKPTAEYYKLKKNEVKDHALKSALEAHARSLWLIPGQTEVPPAVNQDDLKNYATRFSNVHQIDTSVANSIQDRRADRYNKAPEAVTVLKARLASLNGTIAAAINRISEEALLLMYRTVAGMGLERWNPDVSSPDPSSMYNLLHESICLRTFEQACAAQCYVSLGLDMALLKDHHHLQRLYRNFVFNTMHKVFKAELKVPGKAHQTVIMNGIYKRRKSLRDNRVETMQNNGFHAHFLRMGDLNEAHSDDEKVESIISVQPSPSTATTAALSSTSSSQPSGSRPSAGSSASTTATTYVIKTIPGRARKVGKVWRALDEKRKKADARKRRIT